MLQTLKRLYFAGGRRLGLSRVVAGSEWRRRRLLIVGWHGVARDDEHRWDPALYVARETFQRRLRILQASGSMVLPLDEAVSRLAHGTLPARAVVLTFDDGYVDFMTIAWPALKAGGFPATVYLTTKRCEHNRPIVRLLLGYLLWRYRHVELDGHGIPGLKPRCYPLRTATERRCVREPMEAAMMAAGMNPSQKDEVVMRAAAALGADYDDLAARRVLTLMNPEEVRQIAGEGADVQLHTHFHQPPRDATSFRREITENRRRIEALTGRPARHFCYPGGLYRAWQLPILEETRVRSATTCDPGIAGPGSEPYLLPRLIDTEQVSDVEFESWVTGTAGLLPHRTRATAPRAVRLDNPELPPSKSMPEPL